MRLVRSRLALLAWLVLGAGLTPPLAAAAAGTSATTTASAPTTSATTPGTTAAQTTPVPPATTTSTTSARAPAPARSTATVPAASTAPATPPRTARAPAPTLKAIPSSPVAGQAFELKLLDLPPGARDFSWTLSGPTAISEATGSVSTLKPTLRAAGTELVRVSFIAGGSRESAQLTVSVRAARAGAGRTHAVRAHLSSATTVTMLDFKFAPAAITVHAGDTVTWVNGGAQPHSATADGKSFDTGVLAHNGSGGHTFTQAGTFTYFCSVHPFMHGTVVVLAAATKPATTTPAAPAATPTATTPVAPASSSGGLPMTGLDLVTSLVVGLALVAGGIALRRVAK